MFAKQLNVRRSLAILLLVVLSFSSIGSTFAQSFPDVIPLPDGFQPEGTATGKGTTFYVGSIPTGAVYRGDLADLHEPGRAGEHAGAAAGHRPRRMRGERVSRLSQAQVEDILFPAVSVQA